MRWNGLIKVDGRLGTRNQNVQHGTDPNANSLPTVPPACTRTAHKFNTMNLFITNIIIRRYISQNIYLQVSTFYVWKAVDNRKYVSERAKCTTKCRCLYVCLVKRFLVCISPSNKNNSDDPGSFNIYCAYKERIFLELNRIECCAFLNGFALIWALIFHIYYRVFWNLYSLSSKLLMVLR